MQRTLVAVTLASLMVLGACGSKTAPATQAVLDSQLEKRLTKAALVGRSTRLNSDELSGEERYVIEKASKLTGDTWLLQARFQYKGRDLPIPVPVKILWAGDTPVITLTDVSVPGMGSYTARVILHGYQYAGTWSGKSNGGQMFGKIVTAP